MKNQFRGCELLHQSGYQFTMIKRSTKKHTRELEQEQEKSNKEKEMKNFT